MKTNSYPAVFASLLLFAAIGCSDDATRDEEGHPQAAAFERGPHGGRWLADGDFAVELTLFADGVPPEFRAFAYRDREPIDPSTVQLEVATPTSRSGPA